MKGGFVICSLGDTWNDGFDRWVSDNDSTIHYSLWLKDAIIFPSYKAAMELKKPSENIIAVIKNDKGLITCVEI